MVFVGSKPAPGSSWAHINAALSELIDANRQMEFKKSPGSRLRPPFFGAVTFFYTVPRTRTPRAHVTVAAAVAAGDDASTAAEEADDAECPTPILPLMPRGIDADAATPMPGSGARVGLV